jgi:hypothetical protein
MKSLYLCLCLCLSLPLSLFVSLCLSLCLLTFLDLSSFARLTTTLKGKLTSEEFAALKQGLILSGRIDQAISLLEELVKQAEIDDQQTTVTALREEIQNLKSQQENALVSPAPGSDGIEAKIDRPMRSEESKGPEGSFTEHEEEGDEEIMSYASTPSVSTVQMSHLSDILSIQINDVEVCCPCSPYLPLLLSLSLSSCLEEKIRISSLCHHCPLPPK